MTAISQHIHKKKKNESIWFFFPQASQNVLGKVTQALPPILQKTLFVIQCLHLRSCFIHNIIVTPPTTCTTSCLLFCMFGTKIIYFRTHAAHSVFWDSIVYPNFNASLWNLLLIGLEKALKIQSGDREVEFLASTNMLWDKMSFIP